MFTVILLSRASQERFRQWEELFDPFLDSGELAICEWNDQRHIVDLDEAIPDLADKIKGKKEWRLLAIGTGTEGLQGFIADPENPFDYVESWATDAENQSEVLDLSLRDSPIPLARLSHMLLGYPEVGPSAFEPDVTYWDKEANRRASESEFVASLMADGADEATARKWFAERLATLYDVQIHYRQSPLSDEKERKYRELIRRYSARQSAPSEVVFLALREPRSNRPTDDLRSAWQQGEKTVPTQFVARNDYHPACRFVVFDLQSEDRSGFHLAEMRFWLSALSIAINELPSSAFQSDRLYRIDVGLDRVSFGRILNQHMGLLTSARERLEREVNKPRSKVRLEVDAILDRKPVPVSFDSLDGSELGVPTTGYGLATDRPTNEMNRFHQSFSDLSAAAQDFKRKPRRVLANAVESAREYDSVVELPEEPMTRIERDELEEELSQRIRRVTEATTRDILDKERLTQLMEQHRKDIQHTIHERMTRWTILSSSALVGVIWLVVFIPFVFAALQSDALALTESILVVLAVAGALGGVAVGTLILMRRVLLHRLNLLNKAMKSYVEEVKNKASEFGEFLTDVRTYMYGRAFLDADAQRSHIERHRRQEFQRDLQRLREVIEREKSLVRSVGESVEIRRVTSFLLDVSNWNAQEMRALMELPTSTTQCPFNRSGDTVRAAYEFIDQVQLSRLHLVEDLARQQRVLEDLALGPDSPEEANA